MVIGTEDGPEQTKEKVDPEISPTTQTNNPDRVGHESVEPATDLHGSHDKVTMDPLTSVRVCGFCTSTGQL